MMRRRPATTPALAAACAAVILAASHAPAAEVLIARTGAGQLVPVLEFTMPVELPRSVFPGFPGHAAGYPGFESYTLNVPANDRFVPFPTANIEVLVVSIAPNLRIQNDTATGFLSAGDTFLLGRPFFDHHPLWNLVTSTPGQAYEVTFIARDRNHVYTDSAPFTISVTPARCDGDFSNDGAVNTADLVIFLGRFGGTFTPGQPGAECDLNADGVVNTADLAIFLGRFGLLC